METEDVFSCVPLIIAFFILIVLQYKAESVLNYESD